MTQEAPNSAESKPQAQTIWGFPVGRSDAPKDPDARRRGIAMIIALFMIAVMMLFMADMQVNSMVQARLSAANRDSIKAEYMAKSALNLATFLLNVDLAIDLTMAELSGENAQVSDSPDDLWAQLNDIPIGGETLEMMGAMQETFDLSKVNDSAVLDQFKLFDGQFVLKVEDESSRINLNYCGHNSRSLRTACQTFLKALMSCPAEKEFLDRKKVNVDELIGYIEDWVDDNQNPSELTGKGSETDAYAERRPKTQPKNAPFDSLEELRMVEGWDSEIHTIFSPYVTVFPIPPKEQGKSQFSLNFNSSSRAMLNCLFPKASTDCSEKSAVYLERRSKKGPSTSMQGVQDVLRDQLCAEGEGAKYFTYRSDLYRIKAQGEVGDQKKTLDVVVQRRSPDELDAKNNYKASYKYLYYKML